MTRGPRRPRRRRAGRAGGRASRRVAPALIAGAAALAWACGAPASEPASGPVAEEVRAALASGTDRFRHDEWDRLLREGTRDGLVDYAYMAQRRDALDAYLARISDADLAALAPDELKAMLINAYNALTVRSILERPGVASIREIDGVWSERRHDVGGHALTLDNIEHNLLRPFFRDSRIHFAVNCASLSCAPLPPWAFSGEELDAQLERRTEAFLRDDANVRVEDGTLVVSRYFDWYGEDFTAEGWEPRAATIPAFIARYARPEVADFIRSATEPRPLRFLEYDWSLNAVGRAPDPDGASADPDGASAGPAGDPSGATGPVARLRAWVSGFGAAAPLVYALAYVVAVVLLVPGSALTIGAGVAFGIGLGTLVVASAATTGACLAFLIGRYLLRARVERWLRGRERLSAVDRAVERQGWRVVVLTRLSPAFPFNVQNYFYGLTGVSFWQYAAASALAMLPGTLLYVYIGAAGAEVASAAGGAASWGRTALLVAGLAATLLVVVLVTRVARRELRKATGGERTDYEPDSPELPAGASGTV